ncbi:MAG TPA: phosphodiester glycosidase family protein [Chitinophagales bacterium]|nr:phosphodiester glycosidase family protein [Chitinophagales bacterium]
MKLKRFYFLCILSALLISGLIAFTQINKAGTGDFITYEVDPKSLSIDFYWKDEKGATMRSIQNLKSYVESKKLELLFAMNGGMFKADNSPQGLYIEEFRTLAALDTGSGNGNFYLKPNGVFYMTTDSTPVICKTTSFVNTGDIKYATQSGPMLVFDGQIHPAFRESSKNLNIRNGVGILPDDNLIFVMSKTAINFYDFATYFKSLGCENALYLDGFVSRAYLPEKNWIQVDGNFGVIIGVTKDGGK